jgi:hypothetical protein
LVQVVVLEDRRKVNPIKFSVKKTNLRFSPFALNVFYDDKQKISLSELSASFDNVAKASFGMKKLRQNLVLPYSLSALATAQVLNFDQLFIISRNIL